MLPRSLFIVADTLLPAVFLVLSFYAFTGYAFTDAAQSGGLPFGPAWGAAPGAPQVGVAVAVCVGAFWLLRTLGQSRAAFWAVAALGILAHAPAALSHSVLDWAQFVSKESLFVAGGSSFETAATLLASIAALALLHKSIELRAERRALAERRADDSDADRLTLNRMSVFAVLVAACLVLTLATLYAGSAIAGSVHLWGVSSWALLAIGVASIALIALLPLLWLRGRREE